MGRNRKAYERVRVIIGQTRSADLLERFLKAVTVIARVQGPRHSTTKPHHSPVYDFQIAKLEDVHLVCWLLWPWLGNHKRRQFEEAFDKFHAMRRERLGERT